MSLVRFFPTPGARNLDRMVGGSFEGCANGPTSGCQTLATVVATPAFGWNELAVTNAAGYRWLRYVGPDGGYCSVAEIEFIAPSNDSQQVTVQGPAQLRQLGANRALTSYHNAGTLPVHDVQLALTAYATQDRVMLDTHALQRARFATVAPGQTISTAWQIDVPLSAETGTQYLIGRANYQALPGNGQPNGP